MFLNTKNSIELSNDVGGGGGRGQKNGFRFRIRFVFLLPRYVLVTNILARLWLCSYAGPMAA